MAEAVNQDIEEVYAHNVFMLEKEFGASAACNEESLLLKFFNQLERLNEQRKQEEKEMKKSEKARGTFR